MLLSKAYAGAVGALSALGGKIWAARYRRQRFPRGTGQAGGPVGEVGAGRRMADGIIGKETYYGTE